MKIYIVTHESEWDGWIGTSVHATREAAARYINERIDELNEDEETPHNHISWPERQAVVRFDVGSRIFNCEETNLLE